MKKFKLQFGSLLLLRCSKEVEHSVLIHLHDGKSKPTIFHQEYSNTNRTEIQDTVNRKNRTSYKAYAMESYHV